MKVRTNLTPKELATVSKGLKKLAEKQCAHEPVRPVNSAEQQILASANAAFSEYLASVVAAVSTTFTE